MSESINPKADKEAIKAFKKAFKKSTGVKASSDDIGKLTVALQNMLNEMRRWTLLLGQLQPEERTAAYEQQANWERAVSKLEQAGKNKSTASAPQIKSTLALLMKDTETLRKKVKQKPVVQKVGDREVSVFMTDIAGFAELSSEQRKEALAAAAERIGTGLKLYDDIASGKIDVSSKDLVVSTDEVEAVVWALKSKAQEKSGPYQKGAMTIPNGDKMRAYFDKCPEVYSRLSSHLREEQGRNKKGGVGIGSRQGQTPRGMDFYNPDGDDQPGALPSGMNTLLYQQITLPGGKTALYVKMESEGSYGHPGDNRKLDDTVPPDRPKNPKDGARTRKHLKNLLIKAKGDDADLPGLREQTPKPVIEAIKGIVAVTEGKLVKAYLKSSFGTDPKKHVMKKLVPRISFFLDAFTKAQRHAGEAGWEIGATALGQFDALTKLLQETFPDVGVDGDRRLGGEVVVNDDDMATRADPPAADLDDPGYDGNDENEDEDDREARLQMDLQRQCSRIASQVEDEDARSELQVLALTGDGPGLLQMVDRLGPDGVGAEAWRLAQAIRPELEVVRG